jgi:2'-5' RNA ligase
MLRWAPTDNGSAATRTALIVPVPALDPVVGRYRSSLDTAARWGVPAHVTVLYPFLDPVDATADETHTAVGRAVASVSAFDCAFERTAWFGQDVLWLAPVPAGPFAALTRAVWDAFPRTPPYGGTYDDVVPHLTVAELRNGTPEELRQTDADVRPALPVTARIDRVWLVAGNDQPGSWRLAATFPLGQ